MCFAVARDRDLRFDISKNANVPLINKGDSRNSINLIVKAMREKSLQTLVSEESAMKIEVTFKDVAAARERGRADARTMPGTALLKVRPILREAGIVTSSVTVAAYLEGLAAGRQTLRR
jgi:hypothetical protein